MGLIGSALRLIALRVACRTACGGGEMSDAGGRTLIRPFRAPSPGGRREWRVADAVLFCGMRPRGCALDAQASATANVWRCAVVSCPLCTAVMLRVALSLRVVHRHGSGSLVTHNAQRTTHNAQRTTHNGLGGTHRRHHARRVRPLTPAPMHVKYVALRQDRSLPAVRSHPAQPQARWHPRPPTPRPLRPAAAPMSAAGCRAMWLA